MFPGKSRAARAGVLSVLLVAFASVLAPGASAAADMADYCTRALENLPGKTDPAAVAELCSRATVHSGCTSAKGRPIFSIERETHASHPKRILVFGLIHGDEPQAGMLVRDWLVRLRKISPRNEWRVIPILNPDGRAQHTRYNSHGVDLNRNFPSEDWRKNALLYWKVRERRNRRRFPGHDQASEPETRCAMAEIADFHPDLIVSVHAPYGILDFDGPSIVFPSFSHLPWKNLGTYPGSLGRYMWADHHVPVLTVELRARLPLSNPAWFKELQDLAGTLTIRASKMVGSSLNR